MSDNSAVVQSDINPTAQLLSALRSIGNGIYQRTGTICPLAGIVALGHRRSYESVTYVP